MKTRFQIVMMALCAMAMTTSTYAQDKKKYSIYFDMEKNGKHVVVDTSFNSREEMDAYMKSNGFETPEMPAAPGIPRVPAVPGVPAPPAAPGVPDLPDMKEIIIEIDDAKLSEAEKTEMKKEFDKAEKEMRKARTQMKTGKKEMEKAMEEMKKARIEMVKTGENGETIIIRRNSDGTSIENGKRKMVFVNVDDNVQTDGKCRVIKIYCDSLLGDEDGVKIIREIIVEEGESGDFKWEQKTETMPEEEKTAPAPEQSNETTAVAPTPIKEEVTEKSSPAPVVESYELKVSDFKLYPNPTAGKITISFKTANTGSMHIRLLDASGKAVVDDQVMVSDGQFSKEYNIEGKSRGTYLLQIKQGDQWKHEKVVLK